MDAIGRVITVIIAVVMVVLQPLPYIAQMQGEAIGKLVNTITTEFADTARHQGFFTKDMYEDYLEKLYQAGDTYHVEMKVADPVNGKEFASKDNDSLVSATAYTNEKVKTVNLSSTTSHVHTDACYDRTVEQFNYTGGVQSFTAAKSGIYKLKTWGAQGGNTPEGQGGLGGYAEGTLNMYKGQTVYIYVGKQGSYSSSQATGGEGTNVLTSSDLSASYMLAGGGGGAGLNGTRLTDVDVPVGQEDINIAVNGYPGDIYDYRTIGSFTAKEDGHCYFNCKKNWNLYCDVAIWVMRGDSVVDNAPWRSVNYRYGDTIDYVSTEWVNFSKGDVIHVLGQVAENAVNVEPITGTILGNYYPYTKHTQTYTTIYNANGGDGGGLSGGNGGGTNYVSGYNGLGASPSNYYANWTGQYPGGGYGYFSGFASTGGGAGGGASYIGGVNNGVTTTGVNSGNGRAIISYETPLCDRVVTSITATDPVQTVIKGGDIIATATAMYLDGHTGIIHCTVSGYEKNIIGNQTATLTYSGLIDNAKTTGTKTCIVNVTVKDNKKLTGITVTPGTQTIKRYENPTLNVVASYSDGSSKIITGYTITGFNNTILGTQSTTLSYTESGITKTATVQITVAKLTTTCPVCNAVYELDGNDVDNGCPVCNGTIISITASPAELILNKGADLNITVTATYKNGKTKTITGWTSDYNKNLIGLQSVKVTYGVFETYVSVMVNYNSKICPVCSTEYELNEDGSDPGCPICKTEVVSISASPKDISIGINDALKLTVTATYSDRHTTVVTGWYTNFTPDATGTYEVTVFYQKVSDTIRVTVTDHRITCPYCGLEYDYSQNPEGCPICSKTITSIEAALRNGGTKVLYRSNLNLEITLNYRDTHSELVYTGWTVSGYQPEVLGEQTITVNYGEFSTTLTIEVVKNQFMVTCPICGTQYYLNEDGTDPGCPVCSADTKEENAIIYFDVTYDNEILDVLYKDGVYFLKKGDYFTVTVTAEGDSVHRRLQRFLPGYRRSVDDMRKEQYTSGGEVIT